MKFEEYLKKIVLLMIVLGLLYAGITSVFGVQGANSVTSGESSRASFVNSSSASTQVQAGNVTELNISGTAVTEHWAGFYGEITGDMTLANSAGNVFYNWTGLGSISGEVFASTDNAVSWTGIGCASGGEISTIESALGISGTDPDRIELTYNSNAHPDFVVGGASISGCNSTNAYTDTGLDQSAFHQILLTDGEGDAVYTTLINESTTGFNSAAHDFELLAGESDSVGTTAMYFYLELG
jgi:hypothetical protein